MSGHTHDELTIDELARQTGMTVRNVRAHQSRGLLPSPVVRGRTGFYGSEHIERLELIKELQADGFNLEGIRRLIEQAGGHTGDVLRFTREVRSAFEEEEEPEVYELDELIERFQAGPEFLPRALELGILRPIGDGRFEMVSPRLARAGEEFMKIGIPLERALDTVEVVRAHARGIAKAYADLFLNGIFEPFEAAGRPPERWHEVEEGLQQLRPLATEALLGIFSIAMTETIEAQVVEKIQEFTNEAAGDGGRDEPADRDERRSGDYHARSSGRGRGRRRRRSYPG